MVNIYFVLVAVLVVGAANINNAYAYSLAPMPYLNDGKTFKVYLPNLEKNVSKGGEIDENLSGRLLTPEQGCGITQVTQTKIVGGKPSKKCAWPWLALIGYKVPELGAGYYTFKCGGSLISSKHVLTAAHCKNKTLKFVRLGEHDLNSKNTNRLDVLVKQATYHEKYNEKNGKNDIAILLLEHDVTFTDCIRPICLPINGEFRIRIFVDSNPFVAGWGSDREGGQATAMVHQIQVPILENDVCKFKYGNRGVLVSDDQFDDKVFCAGHMEGGLDSCQGDSGGPMMLPEQKDGEFYLYQIGVVAYGIGCGRAVAPGAYTNVIKYMIWINNQIRKSHKQIPVILYK